MTIPALLTRVKKIDLRKAAIAVIQETSADLVELNKKQLYEKSITSEGVLLKLYSSPLYAINKNERNPLPGLFHPDFRDTGAFQDGMYAQVKSGSVIMYGSTDSKSALLEARDGKEIFGLTKDNIRVYALGVFYTGIQKYVTLTTGLRFR